MQALLSEHWHALRGLRPRLRDGVQALHRRLRGKPWVLLADPLSQRFHRLTPEVWAVLELCDGRRTLDEVWDQACAQSAGGTAISQHELVQLVASLHGSDLLQTQVAPDAAELLQRYQRQRRLKLRQHWLNLVSLRLPLLYPDAWFEGRAALARRLFSLPLLLVWLALVLPAAVMAAQHWQALTENLSDRVLSAGNLLLMALVYPLVKAVHELAHGLAVKAWGGRVREIGLMFIVFMPVPYVDASSSYAFPSKWARATVAAAGIAAELFLGAIAVYVWLAAEPGWTTAVAYNVVLIAGVSTLLVNGNPLMRYDGYYVATDLLETPNLAPRATQYWTYLSDRYLLGSADAEPPLGVTPAERWLLGVYGAVAPVYRLLITIGLIWFVAEEYLLLGVVMALMAAWAALLQPLWKGWKHLRDAASLARRREQAKRRAFAWLAAGGLLLGLLPLPFYSVQQGVVWLPDEAILRAAEAGHVSEVRVAPGQSVPTGQVLLQLDNLAVQTELSSAAAALARADLLLRRAEAEEPSRAAPLRSERAAAQARWQQALRRQQGLQLVAASSGRWVPAAPTEMTGRFVQRGELVGYVVDAASRRVRVAVTQEDHDLIVQRLRRIELRLAQRPRVPYEASLLRQVPGGAQQLVSPALGSSAGGEIAVDPMQGEGTQALRRVFDIELGLDEPLPTPLFGDRVWVRFELKPTPLLWQWALRLRQAFLARLHV